GPSAKAFLDLLTQGEETLRRDPQEISVNVARLAGSPRMVYEATNNLKASGEYAIPQLLRVLTDESKAPLRAAVIKLLSDLQRSDLNPLVLALDTNDQVVKQIVIEALGNIGYRQAIPYLARIAEGADKTASKESIDAARNAMHRIDANVSGSAASLF